MDDANVGTEKRGFIDELTPIAVYMAKEMNTNSVSQDCRRMAELNAISAQPCIDEYLRSNWWQRLVGMSPQQCINMELSSGAAALMMWTSKVMQDAEWDHKPKIRKAFLSPSMNSRVWHVYGSTAHYYDVWSNVHYGYVGIAAGFSESALLDGAGLEQIGSDLLRARWPKSSDGVTGLRRFDDFSDRTAIAIGIQLYRLSPRLVTSRQLVQLIVSTEGLTTKAYVPSP